jgi:phosphoadenosine phosphosulfate reductase
MLFQLKFDAVFMMIDQALAVISNPYLSLSWGKDSTTLLWFVRQVRPEIPCLYINSGYALPDTYQLRDRLVKEWSLNYIELANPVNYEELCKEIGLPHERSKAQQKATVQRIKKDVANKFALGHGYIGNFWGLRAAESNARRKLLSGKGHVFQALNGLWRAAPLAWLTDQELWYFIDYNKIPYSGVYDKTLFTPREKIRNAGWLSTDRAHDGGIVWLKYYYPEIYNKLLSIDRGITNYV